MKILGGIMQTGKIVKALAGFYYVKSDGIVYQTRARGIFRKRKESPLVGDIVDFEADNVKEGTITHIHPRKNCLVRPQVANVDQLLITVSIKNPDFSFYLTDRFLAYSESNHITPILIVTKNDLNDDEELIKKIKETYDMYDVYFTEKDTVNESLKDIFQDKLSVLAGQTGVGKSTLLNTLLPNLNLETNEISEKLNRGKHTTRHVELIDKNNGQIADTPGFSTIDFTHIDKEDLRFYFKEFNVFLDDCKFRGCVHINEPKCAVKDALNNGDIKESRYNSYLQIYEEMTNYKERY